MGDGEQPGGTPARDAALIDFRGVLNDEQFRAVTSPDGHSLVIAGAGSGKTRTLTHRVAWLLGNGVAPWRILLLTFTNKAAREMLERVGQLVPVERGAVWGGTFHGIGNRILRRHAELLGFSRDFTILDREDAEQLLGRVLRRETPAAGDKTFPKPAVLADLFGFSVNTCRPIERVVAEKYRYFHRHIPEFERLHGLYEAEKRHSNSMDFDDLLSKCAALFELHPEVLDEYRRQFLHVLVDEFQDTNLLQARFVDSLGGGGASIMAVGDDAQAIYSWRGADCANILEFPRRYPGARVFTIGTNYRSVPEVLKLANAAIGENLERYEKNLSAIRDGQGALPEEWTLPTNNDQARFVAERIAALLATGIEPSEIAVLYRAHFHSMELQMELTRRGIPFCLTSGLRFFEQAHVKDVAAAMKFAVNPLDPVAFTRLARLLPGVGEKSADTMWRRSVDALEGTREFARLHEAVPAPAKSAAAWTQILHTLEELAPEGVPAAPSAMLKSIREAFYDDFLRAEYANADNRMDDLDTLAGFAAQFDDAGTFLSQLALLAETDLTDRARNADDRNKVTLSSVHQAKGLEWRAVFVVWLADGMFPGSRSIENPRSLEEERRLFYVAVTRCKDLLTLTWPRFHLSAGSDSRSLRRSRFLESLPPGVVNRLAAAEKPAWAGRG